MSRDVRISSAAEQVVATLRREILTGQLPGGAPVREHDVAERLAVSRTPVREAVGRLVVEGLLKKDGNRTAHVFRPSLAELLEIYEIRVPLESMAARLACETADAPYIESLEKAAALLSDAAPGIDWSLKHESFHVLVARGSRRPRLESLVSSLRAQSEPYVRFAVASHAGFTQQAQHDHAEILRLIRGGDAKAVERLVRKHLLSTSKRVSLLLGQPSRLSTSGFATPTSAVNDALPR